MTQKIVCPKCKGDGYIRNIAETAFFGICTFGMLPLMDAMSSDGNKSKDLFHYPCPLCKGRKFLTLEIK